MTSSADQTDQIVLDCKCMLYVRTSRMDEDFLIADVLVSPFV